MIQKFEIRYQTAATIPAPYAHFYHIWATFEQNQLRIDYELRYLDREELAEEEIIGEGFSLDDDVIWQGTLPSVWASELQQLLEQTQFSKQPTDEENAFLELVLFQSGGQAEQGEPANRTQWEYLAQEMIQGMYELANRERPLQLQYKRISPKGDWWKLMLTLWFSTRRVEVVQETQQGKTQREVAWHELKDLLRIVYIPDYYPENALTKEPRKSGTYIDNGEGAWYEFDASVRNPSRKRDVLSEIRQAFESMINDR